MVSFSRLELEFFNSFTKILSCMVDPTTGNLIITENNPVELIRFCIFSISAIYQNQIFSDSRAINNFVDKDTKKEFIVFKEKYMNQSLDLQLQDLKRLGLVRQKNNKTVF